MWGTIIKGDGENAQNANISHVNALTNSAEIFYCKSQH